MRMVEDRRRAAGLLAPRQGCLIPVVLRGDVAALPADIRGHVHCCDFSWFTTAEPRIGKKREYVGKIEAIAKFIDELRRSCDDRYDCSTAVMPTADRADHWKPAAPAKAPQPLREGDR